jgi:hypothetical protein
VAYTVLDVLNPQSQVFTGESIMFNFSQRIQVALFVSLLAFITTTVSAAERKASVQFAEFKVGSGQLHPRVTEDGTYALLKLRIQGCKGLDVPIQIFDQAGSLLGEEIANPTYDDSVWDRFPIFIAQSKYMMLSKADVTFYVITPDDATTYLAKSDLHVNVNDLEQGWESLSYTEDATLPSGETGFELTVNLNVIGHPHETMSVVLFLQDPKMADFPPSRGGPIQLPGTRLDSLAFNLALFSELKLHVPYSALEKVGLGGIVILTPAIRFADGRVERGNLHVRFYAGGSLQALKTRITDEQFRVDQRIRDLENELRVIQPRP